MSDDETCIINYDEEKTETKAAKLFDLGGDMVWIPKSQLVDQDNHSFEIPEWLAIEKGLV